MNRPFYLRTQTNVAGDALIGRATSTPQDTLISPQPVYRQLGKRDLIYLTSAGRQVTADDYTVTFSPLSITEDQLQDKTAQFVLKSGADEEVLRILYVNSESFQGETAVIEVIARSVSDNG
jgi:hypothetical protein